MPYEYEIHQSHQQLLSLEVSVELVEYQPATYEVPGVAGRIGEATLAETSVDTDAVGDVGAVTAGVDAGVDKCFGATSHEERYDDVYCICGSNKQIDNWRQCGSGSGSLSSV